MKLVKLVYTDLDSVSPIYEFVIIIDGIYRLRLDCTMVVNELLSHVVNKTIGTILYEDNSFIPDDLINIINENEHRVNDGKYEGGKIMELVQILNITKQEVVEPLLMEMPLGANYAEVKTIGTTSMIGFYDVYPMQRIANGTR